MSQLSELLQIAETYEQEHRCTAKATQRQILLRRPDLPYDQLVCSCPVCASLRRFRGEPAR